MARAACRDPEPGPAGPALERIDRMLSIVEQAGRTDGEDARAARGLVMAAGVIAATEPFTARDGNR
jgi:hypothetical protein